jgi:hypothetical protein
MMQYPLPRADKEKTSTLPQGNLGPKNFTPVFKNDSLAADLDFIQYRKVDAEKSPDLIRLKNYSNYQSVCLAQNLDDLAQDVLQTKSHMNGIHSDLENIEQHQQSFVEQLKQLTEKLDIIQSAIQDLKESLEKERSSPPPISYSELAEQSSFRLLDSTSK